MHLGSVRRASISMATVGCYRGLYAWASEHRGKFGQLTSPIGKMDEKLKSENMQKEQFCEYFESNQCRQV